MHPSTLLLLLSSTLLPLASSTPIEKRHTRAWPAAIRSYFTAASTRLSALRDSLSPSTLASLTSDNCNIASPSMPLIPGLPGVSPGLSLYHVAIGRGTQNYTCNPMQPGSEPQAAGASAILFNTTCMSCLAPEALEQLTPAALLLPTPRDGKKLFPAQALVSGNHYFTESTPTFNLHTENHNYGIQFAKLVAKAAVPEEMQVVGQDGAKAVPWLKLSSGDEGPEAEDGERVAASEEDASPVKEIFRIRTAGGSAPKRCEGLGERFEVEYAAEYWFWG